MNGMQQIVSKETSACCTCRACRKRPRVSFVSDLCYEVWFCLCVGAKTKPLRHAESPPGPWMVSDSWSHRAHATDNPNHVGKAGICFLSRGVCSVPCSFDIALSPLCCASDREADLSSLFGPAVCLPVLKWRGCGVGSGGGWGWGGRGGGERRVRLLSICRFHHELFLLWFAA